MAPDDAVDVTVTLHDGAVIGDVVAAVEAAGAAVIAVHAHLGLLSARAPRAGVAALERVPGVERVDVEPPPLWARG